MIVVILKERKFLGISEDKHAAKSFPREQRDHRI